jgi:hypothetical protein
MRFRYPPRSPASGTSAAVLSGPYGALPTSGRKERENPSAVLFCLVLNGGRLLGSLRPGTAPRQGSLALGRLAQIASTWDAFEVALVTF